MFKISKENCGIKKLCNSFQDNINYCRPLIPRLLLAITLATAIFLILQDIISKNLIFKLAPIITHYCDSIGCNSISIEQFNSANGLMYLAYFIILLSAAFLSVRILWQQFSNQPFFWFLFLIIAGIIDYFFYDKISQYIIITLILILLISHFCKSKQKLRFAHGVCDEDKLEFSNNAKKQAETIANNLTQNVTVFSIEGELGSGKSSYLKMIVEELDKMIVEELDKTIKILYTHISLSETNGSKNFVKLFSQRFYETLNNKYPTLASLDFFDEDFSYITKDYKEAGFLMSFLKIIKKINFAIFGTQSHDSKGFVNNEISKVFNYIPKITEDFWIIAIEEMERNEFDEILRIIEIIENFKNEAREKFPVKIVFILSLDRNEIDKRIRLAGNNEKAQIINSFLENKLIENPIFLPKNAEKFNQFAQNSINETLKKFRLEEISVRGASKKDDIENIKNEYQSAKNLQAKRSAIIKLANYQNSEDFNFLNKETPRVIVRLKNNLNYFLSRIEVQLAKQAELSVKDFLHVKIEDVIFLQFIKTKDPQFYGFLNDNIDRAVKDSIPLFKKEGSKGIGLVHEYKNCDPEILRYIESYYGRAAPNSISHLSNLRFLLTLTTDRSDDIILKIKKICNEKDEDKYKKAVKDFVDANDEIGISEIGGLKQITVAGTFYEHCDLFNRFCSAKYKIILIETIIAKLADLKKSSEEAPINDPSASNFSNAMSLLLNDPLVIDQIKLNGINKKIEKINQLLGEQQLFKTTHKTLAQIDEINKSKDESITVIKEKGLDEFFKQFLNHDAHSTNYATILLLIDSEILSAMIEKGWVGNIFERKISFSRALYRENVLNRINEEKLLDKLANNITPIALCLANYI